MINILAIALAPHLRKPLRATTPISNSKCEPKVLFKNPEELNKMMMIRGQAVLEFLRNETIKKGEFTGVNTKVIKIKGQEFLSDSIELFGTSAGILKVEGESLNTVPSYYLVFCGPVAELNAKAAPGQVWFLNTKGKIINNPFDVN